MQPVILATNEKELKSYSCFSGSGMEGELTLTSARLIYRETQKFDKLNSAYHRHEISIKDIKSISTSTTTARSKNKGVIALILGILLVIAGIVGIIIQNNIATIAGACGIVLGIVLVIVGSIRKKPRYAGCLTIELYGASSGSMAIATSPDHKYNASTITFYIDVTSDFQTLQDEIGAIWQNVMSGRY